MKTPRNPETVHAPLAPYAHQIEIAAGERLLVLSGQLGMALDGSVPAEAADQLELALDNVLRNLEAAGMDVSDLVKLTLYVTELIPPERRGAILRDNLAGTTPCMTLVIVAGLAAPHLKVEVDAWASAPA
jgi:2-iminobutanoate/2-iminopropanoate deaminase